MSKEYFWHYLLLILSEDEGTRGPGGWGDMGHPE